MRLPRPRLRHLDDVFSTGAKPVDHTYVDRGGLDEELVAAARSGKHVVIHGESKQGKTWLRSRQLNEDRCARTQCMPDMTAEEAIESALGRMGVHETIKLTGATSRETNAGARGRGGTGSTFVELSGGRKTTDSEGTESRPVGQDAKDLGWAAEQFREHGRRPVFEDFHHLADDEQKTMAFAVKALGDWQVPCVVAGIWPDQSLLTYYNGELVDRIADLYLRWTGAELRRIVEQGCDALRVRLDEPILTRLVTDAHASAGLLQELTRATLWDAGIRRRRLRTQRVEDLDLYRESRTRVAARLAKRFDPFVDNLHSHNVDEVQPGMFGALVWAVTARLSDTDLLEGIAVDRLASELTIEVPTATRDTVVTALEQLRDAHHAIDVQPAVIAFDQSSNRLVLADRHFLLYRARYSRPWPWRP